MKLWPWSEIERLREAYREAQSAIVRWQDDYMTERAKAEVLQATVDGLTAQIERDLTAHLAVMEHFHAKIDEKDRVILEMRRDGFNPPAPASEMSGEDLGLPEIVADAIAERGFTRQAKEKLSQEARRMLRHGDADEVARQILNGEQSFSWGA